MHVHCARTQYLLARCYRVHCINRRLNPECALERIYVGFVILRTTFHLDIQDVAQLSVTATVIACVVSTKGDFQDWPGLSKLKVHF